MAGHTLLTIHSLSPAARASLLDLLTNSVISLTFGPQSASERVLRLVHPAHINFIPFDVFVSTSTIRAAYDLPGLPPYSIAFFAYDGLNIHPTDTFFLGSGQPGWIAPYCIIDIIADNPSRIIPSRLFIPHEGSNRKVAFLQRTDMLPIFFTRIDGGLGVRIDSNADFDMLLDVPTRVTAHSLKMILHLTNYSSCEKQIQLRTTVNGPVFSRRLAKLIASKVSHIVKVCTSSLFRASGVCRCAIADAVIVDQEAAKENANMTQCADPRWMMGSGVGCIGVGDIELLGIVFVSRGKVTPLLRVRSDFVFVF